MLIDLTKPNTTISPESVGGKGYNLHKLTCLGLPVPPALAILATSNEQLNVSDLQAELHRHEIIATGNSFAVRSSGIGEDGKQYSFAGIFDTCLNVHKDGLSEAILQVLQSVRSTRSRMYATQRSTTVESMSVVIQHMIEADFAGVAFSVCPIERDNRIALLEIVEGCGDSLVSNVKTPATVRINKISGMVRVHRNGADNIPSEKLEEITEVMMPFIEKIENSYGVPVDIEWAIAGGRPYILQARPITT